MTFILRAFLAHKRWCWFSSPCFSTSQNQHCKDLHRCQQLGFPKSHCGSCQSPACWTSTLGQPFPVLGDHCTEGAQGWGVKVSQHSLRPFSSLNVSTKWNHFDSRLFTAVTSETDFATLVSEGWVCRKRHNMKTFMIRSQIICKLSHSVSGSVTLI